MKGFEFLENIAWADLAFRASGASLEELFLNSALALTSAMVDPQTVKAEKEVEIKLEGENPSELLYDFLSEIVLIKDADGILFSKFKVKVGKNKKYYLSALAWGEEINPETQELRDDVKAITRHQFGLKKIDGGFEAQVILDV
jgi:SHS2 domain-containing protein